MTEDKLRGCGPPPKIFTCPYYTDEEIKKFEEILMENLQMRQKLFLATTPTEKKSFFWDLMK